MDINAGTLCVCFSEVLRNDYFSIVYWRLIMHRLFELIFYTACYLIYIWSVKRIIKDNKTNEILDNTKYP